MNKQQKHRNSILALVRISTVASQAFYNGQTSSTSQHTLVKQEKEIQLYDDNHSTT